MYRRLRKRHITARFSLIDELTEAQAGRARQTPEIQQGADGSEILEIPLEVYGPPATDKLKPTVILRYQVK